MTAPTPAGPKTGFPYDLIVAFQLALGPINRLPTWLNEPITAFVVVPLLSWWLGPLIAFPLFLVLSHLYEATIDPWGWSAEDVLWRAYGAVLVLAFWEALA